MPSSYHPCLTRLCAAPGIQIIGGQGTVAVELLLSIRSGDLDVVFVPVGGGGLIAGADQSAPRTGGLSGHILIRQQ